MAASASASAAEGDRGPAEAKMDAAELAAAKVDECHFFYEDEVYRVNRRGHLQFGMVVENSEFASSDEEGDDGDDGEGDGGRDKTAGSERGRQRSRGAPVPIHLRGDDYDDYNDYYDDEDDEERVRKGFVRVAWHPRGNEEIVHERALNLADRSLMPGDVVRRFVRGRDTQRGYCRRVAVFCSVQIMGTDQVIHDVPSKELRPVEDFVTDVVVCMGAWLGLVKAVRSKVTVRFADGSVCDLDDRDAEELEDLLNTRDEESEFRRYDFYPGQVLSGPLRVYAKGNFSHKTEDMEKALKSEKKGRAYRAVVLRCKATSLGVNWQCRTNGGEAAAGGMLAQQQQLDSAAAAYNPPDYYVEDDKDLGSKVRTLNVFEPCTIQIGDRNFYTLKEGDKVMMKPEWKRLERETLKLAPKTKKAKKARTKRGTKKKRKAEEEEKDESYEDVDEDEADEEEDSSDSDNDADEDEPSKRSHHQAAAASGRRPTVPAGRSMGGGAGGPGGGGGGRKKTKKSRRGAAGSAAGGAAGGGSDKGKAQGEFGNSMEVKPGERLAVEVLRTRSEAEVIWQDGTVEKGISSTELFPIHHLDDQEFFCGDFVVRSDKDSGEADSGADAHSYGVVQAVDHLGRTCRVKWFRTYTTGSAEPRPQEVEETEEPVYDLRDHPVFKYRPGSIVIRVANFAAEGTPAHGADCNGGQVLDNYPSGQVLVWWSDGTESFCWPQDLFKIGEYDSDDEGGLWDDEEEEPWSDVDDGEDDGADSWETESEHSVEPEEDNNALGEGADASDPSTQRHKLAEALEKAQVAMLRLEAASKESPSKGGQHQHGPAVMKQFLEVYRVLRPLDRLMGTTFFHEDNFEGLLEKVRDRGRISSTQKLVNEQVNLLFAEEPNKTASSATPVRPMTLLTPAVTPPRQDSDESDKQATPQAGDNARGGHNAQDKAKPTSNRPPPLAQAASTMKNFLVPTAHPGSLAAMAAAGPGAAGSNKSSFDSSCWSKASSMDVHTLSSAASPSGPSPGPGVPLPVSPVNAARAAAAVLASVAEGRDSGCEEEEDETEGNEEGGVVVKKEDEENKKEGEDEEEKESSSITAKDEPAGEEKVKEDSGEVFNDVAAVSAPPPEANAGEDRGAMTDQEVCNRLVTLMRAQLLKAHEEVLTRFGGQEAVFSPEDLRESPEERAAEDLEGIMRIVSSARQRLQEHMNAFASIFSYVGPGGGGAVGGLAAAAEGEGAESTPPRGVSSQEIAEALYGAMGRQGSAERSNSTVREDGEEDKEQEVETKTPSASEAEEDVKEPEKEKLVDISSASAAPAAEEAAASASDIETFSVCESAPSTHKYKVSVFQPTSPKNFIKFVRKEINLLKNSLPEGIHVKAYEDRMDLYSVLIKGPRRTPYEDGVFLFDFQLSSDYPQSPPTCHYHSYCSDRLNPNLYEDGKVCVSLLGTWSGKGTETWSPNSNLLQLLVSIQGLILVGEPYYNEAGYERHRGTQQGRENSRLYNEMVLLKLLQSMSRLAASPPAIFREEILAHFRANGAKMISRLESWRSMSSKYNAEHPKSPTSPETFAKEFKKDDDTELPEFPLIPASKGFCISLVSALRNFRETLAKAGIATEDKQPQS